MSQVMFCDDTSRKVIPTVKSERERERVCMCVCAHTLGNEVKKCVCLKLHTYKSQGAGGVNDVKVHAFVIISFSQVDPEVNKFVTLV